MNPSKLRTAAIAFTFVSTAGFVTLVSRAFWTTWLHSRHVAPAVFHHSSLLASEQHVQRCIACMHAWMHLQASQRRCMPCRLTPRHTARASSAARHDLRPCNLDDTPRAAFCIKPLVHACMR